MKNARNVNYLQVDHKVRQISGKGGIVILTSPEAWKKFSWSRKLFGRKPGEGYFIWVKKQIDFPLAACLAIASPNISQNLANLLVIEKGIKVKANVLCKAEKNNLCGSHRASGRLVLKDNAVLEYNHVHKWGEKDFVYPDYEFILGKNSHLAYNFRSLFAPKDLKLKASIYASEGSYANLNLIINAVNSEVELKDDLFLKGHNANGVIRLRLAGRKNSRINAVSRIFAESAGKGHLDCQGLLIDKKSSITLTPSLIDKNKDALLTHEASIGKIADEQLDYLRARGLSEKEAVDLIVGGFLAERK
ncbi:SufD family Fe-S cluster assembly protein [Candidatus Woesearchaeota archaeon]|nr:SufD family Fe-S cluster assembly protein [Candidatus Woesearchaeota archaeon]